MFICVFYLGLYHFQSTQAEIVKGIIIIFFSYSKLLMYKISKEKQEITYIHLLVLSSISMKYSLMSKGDR